MMAARLASIHCMAMKLAPRYIAFWQMPNRTTAVHCLRVRRVVWPRARAIITAIRPEIRKRNDSMASGEA